MIVEKYIRSLLYEHDCVVIPDFGGFIAHYTSASVHPIRHTFVPPSKEIAFNEMLKLNDGMLISYIASGEGINREEAAKKVRDFAESVRDGIRRHQKYVFEEIGTLTLNYEQKLQFEPFKHINYLGESFGLPELIHKPIDRAPVLPKFRVKDRPVAAASPAAGEKPAPAPEPPPVFFRNTPKSRFRRGLVYALGIPAVFGMSALIGYLWFTDNDKEMASLNPFHNYIEDRTREEDAVDDVDTSYVLNTSAVALSPDEETPPTENTAPPGENTTGGAVKEPTPEPAAPVAEVPKEEKLPRKSPTAKAADAPEKVLVRAAAPKPAEPKAEPKKVAAPEIITEANAAPRYYLIVGGFGVKGNAFKLKKQLQQAGFTGASVLHPASKGLHKVSAADFDNPEAAAAKAGELKGDYASVWVFKF
ncbi:MAG: SPOR domain-containing protein [Cytophagales bacterium]|nr:SPOR domain-containing protein [Cytophagales bacterium]